MITPNKVVSLEASAMGMTPLLLELGPSPIDIGRLYRSVSNRFESIDQFLLSIDILYVLGLVDINFKERTLIYVARD